MFFFFSLYPLGVLRQTEGWKKNDEWLYAVGSFNIWPTVHIFVIAVAQTVDILLICILPQK